VQSTPPSTYPPRTPDTRPPRSRPHRRRLADCSSPQSSQARKCSSRPCRGICNFNTHPKVVENDAHLAIVPHAHTLKRNNDTPTHKQQHIYIKTHSRTQAPTGHFRCTWSLPHTAQSTPPSTCPPRTPDTRRPRSHPHRRQLPGCSSPQSSQARKCSSRPCRGICIHNIAKYTTQYNCSFVHNHHLILGRRCTSPCGSRCTKLDICKARACNLSTRIFSNSKRACACVSVCMCVYNRVAPRHRRGNRQTQTARDRVRARRNRKQDKQ